MNVTGQSFVKGQDFEARDKYVSSQNEHFLPPSERFQRTAADIVGVPATKITVKAVIISLYSLKLVVQEKKWISLLKANHKNSTKQSKEKILNGLNRR